MKPHQRVDVPVLPEELLEPMEPELPEPELPVPPVEPVLLPDEPLPLAPMLVLPLPLGLLEAVPELPPDDPLVLGLVEADPELLLGELLLPPIAVPELPPLPDVPLLLLPAVELPEAPELPAAVSPPRSHAASDITAAAMTARAVPRESLEAFIW